MVLLLLLFIASLSCLSLVVVVVDEFLEAVVPLLRSLGIGLIVDTKLNALLLQHFDCISMHLLVL